MNGSCPACDHYTDAHVSSAKGNLGTIRNGSLRLRLLLRFQFWCVKVHNKIIWLFFMSSTIGVVNGFLFQLSLSFWFFFLWIGSTGLVLDTNLRFMENISRNEGVLYTECMCPSQIHMLKLNSQHDGIWKKRLWKMVRSQGKIPLVWR